MPIQIRIDHWGDQFKHVFNFKLKAIVHYHSFRIIVSIFIQLLYTVLNDNGRVH